MTISQVSKLFQISTRTLRYYEQIGLIDSKKQEDYAYRCYNEDALIKLQQIMILRKLRIPLTEIKCILQNKDASTALEIFEKNLSEIKLELNALSAVEEILSSFIMRIKDNISTDLHLALLSDNEVLKLAEDLKLVQKKIRKETSMKDLIDLTDNSAILKDVRIIYLPPSYVASCHYIGDEPENYVNAIMDDFVRKNNLCSKKPDLRHYGFNHPDPVDESGYHGYEVWVTIPDNMEVPSPLVKKKFDGGLYAAHMIPFGAFNEWKMLFEWAEKNSEYNIGCKEELKDSGWGLLEEHLNYVNHVNLENTEPEGMQLDLLMPITEK